MAGTDLTDQVLRLIDNKGMSVQESSELTLNGSPTVVFIAHDLNGQRWIAKDQDRYAAACLLAELLGCDLE